MKIISRLLRTLARKAVFLAAVFLLFACETSDPGPDQDPPSFTTLSIQEVELGACDVNRGYRMITFDLTWSNNWRTSSCPGNWDAAWIFIKFRIGDGNWEHAGLSVNASEHDVPSGYMAVPVSDGKGVFIRNSDGQTGTIDAQAISLRWYCEENGVPPEAEPEVEVFGVEMVYIPEGRFFAGDNGTSYASLTKGSEDFRSWHITGEEAVEVTNTTSGGHYYNSSKDFWNERWNASEDTSGSAFTIPAAFPKGYRAIYCMKYELSQQKYADFLNTLTPAQAANRYDRSHFNEYGYTIEENGGAYSAEHPDRACGFLSPSDGFAYTDWAGLRPMTELEFEKICRGSDNPVFLGEFAWGTATGINARGITGSEQDREHLTNTGANCYHQEEEGANDLPLNVGIFTDAGKNRMELGAGYYGVMEMSGNLNETCISIGNSRGREFTYHNGDGLLGADGFTDEENWPGPDGVGAGYKGGNFARDMHDMRVSERLDATVAIDYDHRHIPLGFRGVRTILEEY